jgi:8-oxo-dGTP diphosphatase
MIKVGVGAIVIENNSILLVKRLNPPCRDKWAIPGGHLEEGETLGNAASRELLEETGIHAEPIGIIWVDEILPGDCPDSSTHYVLIDVLMKPLSGKLKAATDAVDVAFYQIDSPPMETTRTTLKLIRHIERNKDRLPILPIRKMEEG